MPSFKLDNMNIKFKHVNCTATMARQMSIWRVDGQMHGNAGGVF